MIRIEPRGLKTRTITMIGVATWIGITAFFCTISAVMATDESGWLRQHGGAIIWFTLGVVVLVGAIAGLRDRRLGITLIVALAAAFLCYVVIVLYAYSQSDLATAIPYSAGRTR